MYKKLKLVEATEYTRQELVDKFGTDNIDIINAGREENERVAYKPGEAEKEPISEGETNYLTPTKVEVPITMTPIDITVTNENTNDLVGKYVQINEEYFPIFKIVPVDDKYEIHFGQGTNKTIGGLFEPATIEEINNLAIFEGKEESLQEAEEDEIPEELEDQEKEVEDTIDSEENQEENPVEEETELDRELDELREVLVDLDLDLYRLALKDDVNNVIYIIGKVADESNDILMLVDNKPEEINNNIPKGIEPIGDAEVPVENNEAPIEEQSEEDKKTELEQRFDFVVLPKTFDEVNKLNPRYGEDITPDHETIMQYLMNCLIETNPEAAEELQKPEEPEEASIEEPEELPEEPIEGEEDLKDED